MTFPMVKKKGCRKFRDHMAGITAVMIILGALTSCSNDASGTQQTDDPRKRMVVPVMVSTAVEKTVPVQLKAIGNVQAFSTVSISAQVAGELTAVHFKEGQDVKKGDLLFTIDPAPFESRLKQAEAAVARDKVQLQNARKQVERYGTVAKKGYVSQEQFDQIIATAAALEASVRAGEAAVENARLELKHCTLRSPIDGCTGDLKVHQGNVVKVGDNEKPLVVINQITPIHVVFSVPEQNLPEIKKFMASKKLDVWASAPGDADRSSRGELSFINNAVDMDTGTIQLKAIFTNETRELWPGQFVNVVLTLSSQPNAVVVPSQAVQTGQQGHYVYVVRSDSSVEYRPVVTGRTVDGELVVEKGLSPGEKVVTDGQLRLAPDVQVKVVGSADMVNPQKSSEETAR
jgi:membrane fusion protein, multidrug efflux system